MFCYHSLFAVAFALYVNTYLNLLEILTNPLKLNLKEVVIIELTVILTNIPYIIIIQPFLDILMEIWLTPPNSIFSRLSTKRSNVQKRPKLHSIELITSNRWEYLLLNVDWLFGESSYFRSTKEEFDITTNADCFSDNVSHIFLI